MTYLIIGFVLLMVIAPIFAILPSARQKEQMKLRKLAMGQGIGVGLTTITDPIPKQDKYLSSTGQPLDPILSVAAYRLARPASRGWKKAESVDWSVERRADPTGGLPQTWHWAGAKPALMSPDFDYFLVRELPLLPAEVVKIEEKNNVVTVYWHERSGEAGLGLIIGFLQRCTEIPTRVESIDSDSDNDHS